jgi:hypothetical protein
MNLNGDISSNSSASLNAAIDATMVADIVNATSDPTAVTSAPSHLTSTLIDAGRHVVEAARALHPNFGSFGAEWDRVHIVDEDDWEEALKRADAYCDAVGKYSELAAQHATDVKKKHAEAEATLVAAEQAAAAAAADLASKGNLRFSFLFPRLSGSFQKNNILALGRSKE